MTVFLILGVLFSNFYIHFADEPIIREIPEEVRKHAIATGEFLKEQRGRQTSSWVEHIQAYRSDKPQRQHFEPNVSTDRLKKEFQQVFGQPRNEIKAGAHKNRTLDYAIKIFKENGLETDMHHFSGEDLARAMRHGTNAIGIRPGKGRGSRKEKIIAITAHWDTVAGCHGVVDDGSGSVAVLELARQLSSNTLIAPQFTILFVLFDYEEVGLVGSKAFVGSYLLPYLDRTGAKFIGALQMDMVMNYNTSAGSQTFSPQYLRNNPDAVKKVSRNQNKGDFIMIMLRKNHDLVLQRSIELAFRKVKTPLSPLQLYQFPANMPKFGFSITADVYNQNPTYFASDHAAFWYSGGDRTFPAVLIIDTGPARGVQIQCYHKPCDDLSQLTQTNLDYLKAIIDLCYYTILELAKEKKYAPEKNMAAKKAPFMANLLVAIVFYCFIRD
ncbi:hypothetical protein HDE_01620 [Halotydeus destructor]|nr:hypothetical protein HDE_01620 [Halotydeus destructor]